jgi:cytosine/adenosine deaminase-related metal-dependent hydrolase
MKIFSAKWVVPMDGPPIEYGEVVVDSGSIEAVRPISSPANERIDLGNAVLLPGLINAHSHIEYTALRGFLEDVPFFPWIRALTAIKSHFSQQDWILSAKLGALECLASGITTIGDNTDSGASLDAAVHAGLRGRIYQELFCIDHRTPPADVLDELVRKLAAHSKRKSGLLDVGISPHATYTINPEMFKAIREDPRTRDLPISIHVAESPAEMQLISEGNGPFAEMFERRGIQWQSPRVSPTQYVANQGILGKNTLIIHCTHQSNQDITLTAQSGAAIIHCPKSNAKLGAGIAPLAHWLKRTDLRLGIGTDSALSNNAHDLFEEMRFGLLLQRAALEEVLPVNARHMLELATSRGADALGFGNVVGTLTPGKRADLIAVDLGSLHVIPATDPVNALVYSSRASDVKLTVIDGRVCYSNGQFTDIDTDELRANAAVLAERISMIGN